MKKKSPFNFVIVKIALFAGIVALGFVLVKIYKETVRKKQIQDVIVQLQAEADRIDHDNRKMKENLEFLSSSDYLEIEAKDKLNQKNPDEEVIVLKTNVTHEVLSENVETPENRKEEKIAMANHLKWWNYFFKY